jgi:hypothetical protein
MRVAQVFTLALGLGLSTAAIGARIYVKLRIWRQFLSEDCKVIQTGHTRPNRAKTEQISQPLAMYVECGWSSIDAL